MDVGAGTDSFDFIIVGAGSAGCVLAERLSADPAVSVLLVEAGPPGENWLVRMPLGFAKTLADPRRTFAMPTAYPKVGSPAIPDIWMRGRIVGGSSALNGMVWMRGQPQDYQHFAELGLHAWGWEEMLPCFKAIEDHALGADELRGTGGPIKVRMASPSKLGDAIIAAGEELGLPKKIDHHRLEAEGLGYVQHNIDGRGRRVSAARAFLEPALRRPNLKLITGIEVGRVFFEGTRAAGVEARKEQRAVTYRVRDGGEVILSAGAINSPAILQRSGIGPGRLLSSLGIPVVSDSPGVGSNMREHWLLALQFRLREARYSNNLSVGGVRLLGNILRYQLFGSGPLARSPYLVGGFFRSRPEVGRADAQFLSMPFSQDETGKTTLEAEPGIQFFAYQCRPESQGTLAITSADPAAPLDIRPNYHTATEDRRVAVNMVRFMRRLANASPLREFISRETRRTVNITTDEEILSAFERYGQAGYHACGTCRMGIDPLAVVDERLRVRGATGLRVVDLSIVPEMISANTNAPTMAMAWRAAQLIRKDRSSTQRLREHPAHETA